VQVSLCFLTSEIGVIRALWARRWQKHNLPLLAASAAELCVRLLAPCNAQDRGGNLQAYIPKHGHDPSTPLALRTAAHCRANRKSNNTTPATQTTSYQQHLHCMLHQLPTVTLRAP
jgi:hypothetical protein